MQCLLSITKRYDTVNQSAILYGTHHSVHQQEYHQGAHWPATSGEPVKICLHISFLASTPMSLTTFLSMRCRIYKGLNIPCEACRPRTLAISILQAAMQRCFPASCPHILLAGILSFISIALPIRSTSPSNALKHLRSRYATTSPSEDCPICRICLSSKRLFSNTLAMSFPPFFSRISSSGKASATWIFWSRLSFIPPTM